MRARSFAAAAVVAISLGSAVQSQDGVKLGVVSVNYNSPSIQRQTDAAITRAEELGWEVELFDGRGD